MARTAPPRPPSDAAAISALIARSELAAIDAERARLIGVMESLQPRRSTIIETRLKQLTRRHVELVAAIARASR